MPYAETNGSGTLEIDMRPATEEAAIARNVAMLMSSTKYDVPLMCGYGLTGRHIDGNPELARSVFVLDLAEATDAYEPRASIAEAFFEAEDGGGPGSYRAIARFNLREGWARARTAGTV